VELDGEAIDKSQGQNLKAPLQLYTMLLGEHKRKTYTREQARVKVLETGHWGPWED